MKYTIFIFTLLNIAFSKNLKAQYFIPGQSLPYAHYYEAVEFYDLDLDGDLDFIRLSDEDLDEIWLNDGTGFFTFHDFFGSIGSTKSIACDFGDLDGDGDIDIFVANSYGHNKVWLNDGAANFTYTSQPLGSDNAFDCAMADYDNDGDLDVAVSLAGNTNHSTWLFFNDGNAQFVTNNMAISNLETLSVETADIDNDGDMDLIESALLNTPNGVLLNDGFGNFINSGQNLGSGHSEVLAVGDCNSDGYKDIIFETSGDYSGIFSLYLGGANATFTYDKDIDSNTQITEIDFIDIDQDTDLDLVISIFDISGYCKILVNDGAGNYSPWVSLSQAYVKNIAFGDIDNDGDVDLMLMSLNSTLSRFWYNQQTLAENATQEICANDSIWLQNAWRYNPGIYIDTITDINGNDSILQTTNLSLLPVEYTWNYSICQDDSILINNQYTSTPGMYYDSLISSNGCDSINIYHINILGLNNTITDEGAFLEAPLSSINNLNYQWFDCNEQEVIPNEIEEVFYPWYTGSYSAIMSNGFCTDTSDCFQLTCKAFFEWEEDTTGVYDLIIYAYGFSSPNTSYLWEFGDGDTSSLPYPAHTYAGPGYYYLCFTVSDNDSGCSNTFCDTIPIDVIKASGDFSINVLAIPSLSSIKENETSEPLNIKYFPNPTSGKVWVTFDSKIEESLIIVYDLQGKIMKKVTAINQDSIELDLSDEKSGLYLIQVTTKNNSNILKIIKE